MGYNEKTWKTAVHVTKQLFIITILCFSRIPDKVSTDCIGTHFICSPFSYVSQQRFIRLIYKMVMDKMFGPMMGADMETHLYMY